MLREYELILNINSVIPVAAGAVGLHTLQWNSCY
eukprot:XP_001708545.1 Hypothetical protein GL50803_35630 [Giardia lamblia ATCC 50803]